MRRHKKILCALFLIVFPSIGICQGENPFSAGREGDVSDESDVVKSQEATRYVIEQSLTFSYRNSRLNEVGNVRGLESDLNELFVDYDVRARFNDRSAAYMRGMADLIHHRQSGLESVSKYDAMLLEGYYEFANAESSSFYTVGRKKIYWSSGFQFRPADVLEKGRTAKNFDLIDPRMNRGWDIIQYQKIGEKTDFSLVVASASEAAYVDGVQYASRLEYQSVFDFALFGAKVGDYSTKLGMSIDSAAPFSSTFRLEMVAVRVDDQQLYQPDSFGSTLESMSGRSSYNEVLTSFTHFFDDRRRFNVEYFYNGSGFGSSNISEQVSHAVGLYLSRGNLDPTILAEPFETQYLRRNYFSMSYTGYLNSLGIAFSPRAIIGADDKSSIISLSVSKSIIEKMALIFETDWYEGENQSEFGGVAGGFGVSLALIINAF